MAARMTPNHVNDLRFPAAAARSARDAIKG